MAKKPVPLRQPTLEPLTKISVSGFKSIGEEQSIEVAPLTILAGVNSSGKSSIMQPLLLLKQTLEAPYDPGALLLNGPNVKFTKVEQFLHSNAKPKQDYFEVSLTLDALRYCNWKFQKGNRDPIELTELTTRIDDRLQTVFEGEFKALDHALLDSFPDDVKDALISYHSLLVIKRERCFFNLEILELSTGGNITLSSETFGLETNLTHLIHLPGLRGHPQRSYNTGAVTDRFPGTFDHYTASVIAAEARTDETFGLKLGRHLQLLGLTWKVVATPVDDTQVELKVGRLPKSAKVGTQDLVNIADVGFGVSQTLPVVVALLVAKPNQTVYIEQPEIHLHPKAQYAMAELLVDAANRGVRVIIETHSSMLLIGVQTLVAQGKISPDNVRLHWFSRDPKHGNTTITTAEIDDAGRTGDWPVDFDNVLMDAQDAFLTAAQKRIASNGKA